MFSRITAILLLVLGGAVATAHAGLMEVYTTLSILPNQFQAMQEEPEEDSYPGIATRMGRRASNMGLQALQLIRTADGIVVKYRTKSYRVSSGSASKIKQIIPLPLQIEYLIPNNYLARFCSEDYQPKIVDAVQIGLLSKVKMKLVNDEGDYIFAIYITVQDPEVQRHIEQLAAQGKQQADRDRAEAARLAKEQRAVEAELRDLKEKRDRLAAALAKEKADMERLELEKIRQFAAAVKRVKSKKVALPVSTGSAEKKLSWKERQKEAKPAKKGYQRPKGAARYSRTQKRAERTKKTRKAGSRSAGRASDSSRAAPVASRPKMSRQEVEVLARKEAEAKIKAIMDRDTKRRTIKPGKSSKERAISEISKAIRSSDPVQGEAYKIAAATMAQMKVKVTPKSSSYSKKYQVISAKRLMQVPALDAYPEEEIWDKLKYHIVPIAGGSGVGQVAIKSGYNDDFVYFFMRWRDDSESITHMTWVWDEAKKSYQVGDDREDAVALLFAMDDSFEGCMLSGKDYRADLWEWLAGRTNASEDGYADDKYFVSSTRKLRKANKLIGKNGKPVWLQIIADAGNSPFTTVLPREYKWDQIPRFSPSRPTGSRADIRAVGYWANGEWMLEISRRLTTNDPGHDIQFDLRQEFLFSVAIYQATDGQKHDKSDTLVLQFR